MAPYSSESEHQEPSLERSAPAMEGADILNGLPSSAVPECSASKRGQRYACEFCQQTFKRRDEHDRHRFSHTGVYEYMCLEPGCGKGYSNRSHLLRHTRANHLERPVQSQPELPCKHPNCTMKFSNKHAMKRHYQVKHVLGKPYACDVCSERFWRKLQLKLHKVRHTGEYPHRCDHCNQGFVNLKSMRDHRCKRNAQTCADCSKEFARWTELVAHRRLEHPAEFRCEQCGKLFHTKRNLNLHGRVHRADAERVVYECPHAGCPRFYEHERNLYAHVRAKHDKRKGSEHVCPVEDCGRVLATKQKLDQHQKLHLRASKVTGRKKTKPAAVEGCSSKDAVGTSSKEETTAEKVALPVKLDQKSQHDVTTDSEVENTQTVQELLESNVQLLCTQLDTLRSSLAPM
ncbi:zinc finger protein 551 [Anopheles stephensi]|uniref:C2H2-type domain-containing protein n=1 Tax=Anopheles stephensi TaxID=30069 RepID=A0A182Y7S8_ANOST|nr:zinc finger protein 551 [Anopheles stephensi]